MARSALPVLLGLLLLFQAASFSMAFPNGVFRIHNQGLLGFSLDFQQQTPPSATLAVVTPVGDPAQPGSQKWAVYADAGAYTIKNALTGLYLGTSDYTTVLLTPQKQLWDIIQVGGNYKIQLHNVGTCLELQSGRKWTPVTLGNYQGLNQQWTLARV